MNITHFFAGVIRPDKGSVQKRFIVDNDKLTKDGEHSLSIASGTFQDVAFTGLDDFGKFIAQIQPDQPVALTIGTCGRPGVQQLTYSADKYGLARGKIARTKENIQYRGGLQLALFDVDPEPGQTPLDDQQLWAVLCEAVPELAKCGRLVTASSSSHIYDTAGNCVVGAGGYHLYILYEGDLSKLRDYLKTKLWAAGKGFHKLGAANSKSHTCAVLERWPIDMAVLSAERVIYEAPPKLPQGYSQQRPAPQYYPGDVLRLSDLPPITADQQLLADANRRESETAIRDQQLNSATEAIAKNTGVNHKIARKQAKAAIKNIGEGWLEADHVIHLADGGTVLAGDIDRSYNQSPCCDPQEPGYNGNRKVAKIYVTDDGFVQIHSFAHGEKLWKVRARDVDDAEGLKELIDQGVTEIPVGELKPSNAVALPQTEPKAKNNVLPSPRKGDSEAESIWLGRRVYTPDFIQDERYVSYDSAWFGLYDWIVVSAAMGAGKTYSLTELVHPSGPWGSSSVIMFSSRNATMIQTIAESNKRLRETGRQWHHYQADKDKGSSALYGKGGLCSMAIDSLYALDVEQLVGRKVVLDEGVALAVAALVSSTLSHKRQVVLEKLGYILRHASQVIILDGNMRDWIINLFKAIAKIEPKVLKVKNTFKPATLQIQLRTVLNRDGKAMIRHNHGNLIEQVINDVREHMAADTSRVVALLADNRAFCESAAQEIAAQTGGDVLLLDSNTICQKEYKEILANLPTFLRGQGTWVRVEKGEIIYDHYDARLRRWDYITGGRKIVAVVMSPSCTQGYDISGCGDIVSHTGYAAFDGIIGTDDQMQFLRRWRDITQWVVDCAPYSKFSDDGSANAAFQNNASKLIAWYGDQALQLLHGEHTTDADRIELLQKIALTSEVTRQWDAEQGRIAYERANTYECFKVACSDHGWEVSESIVGRCKDTEDTIKDRKRENKIENAIAVFHALEIEKSTADDMKNSWSLTKEERHQVTRAFLVDKIPGFTETEYWNEEFVVDVLVHQPQLLNRLQNYVKLNMPQSIGAALRTKLTLAQKATVFVQDLNFKRDLQLCYLLELGILDFATGEIIFDTNEHYKQVVEQCRLKPAYKLAFGKCTKRSERRFFNNLCQMAGLKIVRHKSNGQTYYSYESPLLDERNAVLVECIEKRQKQKIADQAERLAQHSVDTGEMPLALYIDRDSYTLSEDEIEAAFFGDASINDGDLALSYEFNAETEQGSITFEAEFSIFESFSMHGLQPLPILVPAMQIV
jgi:hypothetical protein